MKLFLIGLVVSVIATILTPMFKGSPLTTFGALSTGFIATIMTYSLSYVIQKLNRKNEGCN